MPSISYYDKMSVELMQATPYPATILALAMSITMKSQTDVELPLFTKEKAKYLLEAEHESLFEHVVYTFLIQGISRSFLAQITRQRTASPTSGSQHYQNYADYPCAIRSDARPDAKSVYQASFNQAYADYELLLKLGEPKEEARQVLPNAATVNYLWTIDALNLAKFLRKRACHRNVEEMQVFADKIYNIVLGHFPELFSNIGPQCFEHTCKQGSMRCKEGKWTHPNPEGPWISMISL